MPRRNLFFLVLVAVISVVCYGNVQNNRYGRILVDAMEQIERRYLEPIGQDELFEGAMEGMIRRLGDQYAGFMRPKRLQQFHQSVKGEFGGVGIEMSFDPKTRELTVMRPMVGTPAYEAGILAGDIILKIDGQDVQSISMDEVVDRIRGKPGQPVTLTIRREGEKEDEKPAKIEEIEIEITRKIIRVDTVLGDTREPDGSWNFFLEGHDSIGYLRVNTFGDKTPTELRRAIEWLLEHGMQGLILDLRYNPGGLLDEAVEVCDMFIDSGEIVTTRRRDKSVKKRYVATKEPTFGEFPMAVLVNRYSASASEIVAACLQDHGRAKVVGQRTWGKGTVQEVVNLEGGYGLKLTTLTYLRPNGKDIHKGKNAEENGDWGVTPDEGYEVVVKGEELVKLRLWRRDRDAAGNGESEPFVDRQLAKAVEYVENEIRGK